MTYVEVALKDPEGRGFTVEIDSDLSAAAITAQLVAALKLPPDVRYELLLVDSLTVRPGDKVELRRAGDQGVRNLVPE